MKIERLNEDRYKRYYAKEITPADRNTFVSLPPALLPLLKSVVKQYSIDLSGLHEREKWRDVAITLKRALDIKDSVAYEIHHLDFNPGNDSRDNLVLIPRKLHLEIHRDALSCLAELLWMYYQDQDPKNRKWQKDFNKDLFRDMIEQDIGIDTLFDSFQDEMNDILNYYRSKGYRIIYLKNIKEITESPNSENESMNESKTLNEASYGGAFDIEDNQYFTRDDLNELMDDINDRCRTQFPERGMEAIEAYMSEDGKTLEVVMEDADYGEESVFVPIDMRSIRKPSDLLKYSNRVIKEFIKQADNFNAYYDHVNSFYGEQLDEALGEGPADFIVLVYTVDEELELKDKLAEVEVTLGELYDEYGKDRIDYLLKRANYASYVREHRLGYALEHLISDFALKKFREANPEHANELLSNDRPIVLNGNLIDSGVEELGKVLGKKLLPHL